MEPVRKIEGRIQVLDRSDVDTDQIISKQYLKRIERTGFGEFLFADWRKEGLELDRGRPILVTERNFGCGSSREHAVWALQDFGFRAVVAPSFADIFYGNCTKTGLLPVVLPAETVRELMEAERATVDLERQVVEWDGGSASFDINPDTRRRLLEGLDEIALTLENQADIDRFEGAGRAGRLAHHICVGCRDAAAASAPPGEPPPTQATRPLGTRARGRAGRARGLPRSGTGRPDRPRELLVEVRSAAAVLAAILGIIALVIALDARDKARAMVRAPRLQDDVTELRSDVDQLQRQRPRPTRRVRTRRARIAALRCQRQLKQLSKTSSRRHRTSRPAAGHH